MTRVYSSRRISYKTFTDFSMSYQKRPKYNFGSQFSFECLSISIIYLEERFLLLIFFETWFLSKNLLLIKPCLSSKPQPDKVYNVHKSLFDSYLLVCRSNLNIVSATQTNFFAFMLKNAYCAPHTLCIIVNIYFSPNKMYGS